MTNNNQTSGACVSEANITSGAYTTNNPIAISMEGPIGFGAMSSSMAIIYVPSGAKIHYVEQRIERN